MTGAKPCQVDGCGRRRRGTESWCESHRYRLRVHGDVLAHLPIGRMRNGVLIGADPEPDDLAVAYAPTPAEGHGFLWLV